MTAAVSSTNQLVCSNHRRKQIQSGASLRPTRYSNLRTWRKRRRSALSSFLPSLLLPREFTSLRNIFFILLTVLTLHSTSPNSSTFASISSFSSSNKPPSIQSSRLTSKSKFLSEEDSLLLYPNVTHLYNIGGRGVDNGKNINLDISDINIGSFTSSPYYKSAVQTGAMSPTTYDSSVKGADKPGNVKIVGNNDGVYRFGQYGSGSINDNGKHTFWSHLELPQWREWTRHEKGGDQRRQKVLYSDDASLHNAVKNNLLNSIDDFNAAGGFEKQLRATDRPPTSNNGHSGMETQELQLHTNHPENRQRSKYPPNYPSTDQYRSSQYSSSQARSIAKEDVSPSQQNISKQKPSNSLSPSSFNESSRERRSKSSDNNFLLSSSVTSSSPKPSSYEVIAPDDNRELGPWPWAPAPIRHWWATHQHRKSRSSSGSGDSDIVDYHKDDHPHTCLNVTESRYQYHKDHHDPGYVFFKIKEAPGWARKICSHKGLHNR